MGNFYTDVIQPDSRYQSTARIGDLDLLEPVLRELVEQILEEAWAHGVEYQVFETYRSQARQTDLFNAKATELRTVGVHHYGLACDLVKVIAGDWTWKGDYSLLGRLAAAHGLIWGGDWGRPDLSHTLVDPVHVQRCALVRQAALFSNAWYPDQEYNAVSNSDASIEQTLDKRFTSRISIAPSQTTGSFHMADTPTEAGNGESHVYRITSGPSPDQNPLTANQDYLGVDAVAWYVNKQSSWFHDRTASGILTIQMDDGAEKYQTSLGTFELSNGQKTAPVFGTAVLPDRNYVGGSISLAATLTAIRKDTVIGGLITSAASAGLGIIAGMVHTASVTGPAQILTAAGDQLISGIKKVLDDPSVKSEPLFDPSGVQIVLQATDIRGPENYVLLHRGARLDESKLSLGKIGALPVPLLGGQPLIDGVWLLLRLRRSQTYSGYRDWYPTAKKLREDISFLVTRVSSGALTKDLALKEFLPGSGGSATLWDRFAALQGVIADDGVLSEVEALSYVGKLAATLAAAKDAISKAGTPGPPPSEHFAGLVASLDASLSSNEDMHPVLLQSFLDQASLLKASRTLAQMADADHPAIESVRAIGGGGAALT